MLMSFLSVQWLLSGVQGHRPARVHWASLFLLLVCLLDINTVSALPRDTATGLKRSSSELHPADPHSFKKGKRANIPPSLQPITKKPKRMEDEPLPSPKDPEAKSSPKGTGDITQLPDIFNRDLAPTLFRQADLETKELFAKSFFSHKPSNRPQFLSFRPLNDPDTNRTRRPSFDAQTCREIKSWFTSATFHSFLYLAHYLIQHPCLDEDYMKTVQVWVMNKAFNDQIPMDSINGTLYQQIETNYEKECPDADLEEYQAKARNVCLLLLKRELKSPDQVYSAFVGAAASHEQFNLVEYALNKTAIVHHDKFNASYNGYMAFSWLMYENQVDIIKKYFFQPEFLDGIPRETIEQVVSHSCQEGALQAVQLLLQHSWTFPIVTNSCLVNAAMNQHAAIVEMILDSKSLAVSVDVNAFNHLAFQHAIVHGNHDMFHKLLQHDNAGVLKKETLNSLLQKVLPTSIFFEENERENVVGLLRKVAQEQGRSIPSPAISLWKQLSPHFDSHTLHILSSLKRQNTKLFQVYQSI